MKVTFLGAAHEVTGSATLLTTDRYKILVDAVEAELPYKITCPAMLICGTKDMAGSTKRYNRAWHARTGIPIHWIEGAGHNANTDRPDEINDLIAEFIKTA